MVNTAPLETVEKILAQYKGASFLVGYSGGRDSHVLLDILIKLRDQGKMTSPIKAIHINHGLSSDAESWVRHCQRICSDYNLLLTIETVQTAPAKGQSIEAFARDARYQLIAKHLQNNEIFLSAHHQQDQVETFLLQLMRGAGIDGLRAMPVERLLGNGHYVRPLLSIAFSSIKSYAVIKQLAFINDSSNDDTRFDRNFLRHRVLPVLRERFSHADAAIAQSAEWLAEESHESPISDSLTIKALLSLSVIEQKRTIRAFVKQKTNTPLSLNQTNYIVRHHLSANSDKHPVVKVGNYDIRRWRGELCVTYNLPDELPLPQKIDIGPSIIASSLAQLQWQKGSGLDANLTLEIGPLLGGQRFHPQQRSRATTVKKLINEENIPVWLRPHYVGLYHNDELVAIPGVGIAKAYFQKGENAYHPCWIIERKFVKM